MKNGHGVCRLYAARTSAKETHAQGACSGTHKAKARGLSPAGLRRKELREDDYLSARIVLTAMRPELIAKAEAVPSPIFRS